MRISRIFGLLLGVVMVGACSPDCVSLCEEADEEGCFGDDGVDCEDSCAAFEEMAEEESCEEDWQAYLDCVDDSEDVCDGFTDDCYGKADGLEECIEDYCADQPDSNDCEAIDALD